MSNSKISFTWNGEALKKNISEEIDNKIIGAALDLKQRSSEQAPIDTGDLRGNCSVVNDRYVISRAEEGEDIEKPDTALVVRIGYSLPYALIQHEDLQFHHPRGGKAKYLEDPFNQKKNDYIKAIQKAAGDGVKK